jgi:tRNA G18 (ribose-2'-O)-methylase SpoU|tara:strand:+ start:49 stop:687 length:639 start_codon:yes stop_codon:yes gene_type:complete
MSDNDRWSLWKRNVIDEYKSLTDEKIREELKRSVNPVAVCMEHWKGDFNISTLIRNANAFNVEKVYYLGKKRIDVRGAVGAHHYMDIDYLDDGHKRLVELKNKYTFIAVDNNVDKTHKLREFDWNKLQKPPLILFGEEGCGLTEEVLNLADYRIEIEQYGSVRSLNVGTASGIVLFECVQHLRNSKAFRTSQTELYDGTCNEQSEPSQLTLL